ATGEPGRPGGAGRARQGGCEEQAAGCLGRARVERPRSRPDDEAPVRDGRLAANGRRLHRPAGVPPEREPLLAGRLRLTVQGRLAALGMPNAIAVIAVAERGTMFFPGPAVYMDKIAVGLEAADAIDIEAPPGENVKRVAKAKGIPPEEVTVVVLDRDRHTDLIA